MLYGVVDLETLPARLDVSAYGGQVAIYFADGTTGDFIVDTWHNSLGNVTEMSGRTVKRGYSSSQLQEDFLAGKTGHCVFVSKSIGGYLYFYYEPTPINNWMIGISVAEDIAFARVKHINTLLIRMLVIGILLLAAYSFWFLRRTNRKLREKQHLAENDLLTGSLNRNSYETHLHTYSARCRTDLTCIYMDANGLHELNNTKGHTAGDAMLQAIARCLRQHFGEQDTYRIGGDEFVALVCDCPLDDIIAKLEQINAALNEQGYHVSIGLSREDRSPIQTEALIKQAEFHMYEEKQRYYEESAAGSCRLPAQP